ncbi:MAG: ribosome biogenesis GTPase Der [Longimicrobiales bacterium]
MSQAPPAVAIVGRPNVGKSTLFNRILGEQRAIVEDEPGVTRDRNIALTEWAGRAFYVIDTGGLEPETEEAVTPAVRRQVLAAIAEAEVIVLLVDGRTGPHPVDHRIAELLRKTERPVLVVVNKVDRLPYDPGYHEFWELGLGEPLPVSAISGKGSGDLLDAVVARLPVVPPVDSAPGVIRIAVIGRPNVGKSSFINRLLSEERLVVSAVAGTTRDAIDTPLRYHGRELIFIDTAGLRRQSRIEPGLEYYSSLRTRRSLERADVCLLLIDVNEGPHVQDLRIAAQVWEAGRGLIIVANKWDLVEKETMTSARFTEQLQERVPFLRWAPILFASALSGQRVHQVLETVLAVDATRHTRIGTHELTEAVRLLAERQPPPHFQGRPVKLYYATQAGEAPPTVILFTNWPKGITESYSRYLHNGLRERWPLQGTPLRLRFRGRKEEE